MHASGNCRAIVAFAACPARAERCDRSIQPGGLLREGSIDFHRSWTGYHIFHLPLERGRGVAGAIATKLVVNRDPRQYRNTDPGRDLEQVEWLLACTGNGPWVLHAL